MDTSAVTLLILFSVNLLFLLIILISFGVIRRVRGDKAKVKITKDFMMMQGVSSDLETHLLDTHKSTKSELFKA